MFVAECQKYFIAPELTSRYSRWYVNSEKQSIKMWSKCLSNSWLGDIWSSWIIIIWDV